MVKYRPFFLIQRGSSCVEYAVLLSVMALMVILPAMHIGDGVSASFLQTAAIEGGQNSGTFFQAAMAPQPGNRSGGGTESGTKHTGTPPGDPTLPD